MKVLMSDEEEKRAPRRIVATGVIRKRSGGQAVGSLVVEKEFAEHSLAATDRDFPENWFPFRTPDTPIN